MHVIFTRHKKIMYEQLYSLTLCGLNRVALKSDQNKRKLLQSASSRCILNSISIKVSQSDYTDVNIYPDL